MKTHTYRKAFRPFSLLSAAAIITALTGCGQLQDVRHRWCDPEPVVSATPPVDAAPELMPEPQKPLLYKVRLQADMLFQFDGTDLSQMKPSARLELDSLVEQLRNDYIQIAEIVVIGHTDRLGSKAYNQGLSERRAQTVKQYLQSKGVSTPIAARGMGKTEPVTTDCVGSKATPALVQCLQPDRRVEVDITGLKKKPAATQPQSQPQ